MRNVVRPGRCRSGRRTNIATGPRHTSQAQNQLERASIDGISPTKAHNFHLLGQRRVDEAWLVNQSDKYCRTRPNSCNPIDIARENFWAVGAPPLRGGAGWTICIYGLSLISRVKFCSCAFNGFVREYDASKIWVLGCPAGWGRGRPLKFIN